LCQTGITALFLSLQIRVIFVSTLFSPVETSFVPSTINPVVFLKIVAYIIIGLYVTCIFLLYLFQTKIIFHPGSLAKSFPFRLDQNGQEVFIETKDKEIINGLFYRGSKNSVILYFHGNAGDLSGWQFVAEDFTQVGFNVLIIDYRGYGKSTGAISENGMYADAQAAYDYLIEEKNFTPSEIIIYGRSIGTGVAVWLASEQKVSGLVLEAPYTSLPELANEKLPLFFPSLYLNYRFNNLSLINKVRNPIIFIHGQADALIPSRHSETLYHAFKGRKQMITIANGSHNDLNGFPEYEEFIGKTIDEFFKMD
jgi:uncharacterized protein